ncbi:Gfo/Idh/MocA family protein [Actinophytocola gossypii]|uniref:Gfo/Idh/MocA family oxidoreductase n=1 Tax=Actinophytocola gossypii TaxID=2812003 RepID=A0ABT2JIH3_9PSEU|nr:Gfo/Idh/MocA family oxidoreductase [Actinophytocola gossypii]MCT2587687.1 Gfo/Idh/MocA family oxidoreductase [Actinophytocola gossypii]
MGDALRIGVIGAGNIIGQYLDTLPRLPGVRITAVADLDPARAAAVADAHDGVRATDPADLCTAEDVDLVLNLTVPAAHADVALAAIAGGKHVYTEKPLALTTGAAREVLDAAARAGVRVGCAPDTVLGTGTQTARRCVDDGRIGRPVAATAFLTSSGPERWHPSPEFFYRTGGGPLFDMGPYYLTALVTLLGPVARVSGMAATPRATRVVGSGPLQGTEVPVEVATHVTGLLEHESGALSTLVMSFDVWAAQLPRIEVYGTEGSVSVPDPNGFGGEVRLFTSVSPQWTDVAVSSGHRDAGRGIGVADLAGALVDGGTHRASGELAHHVLDVMESLLRAADSGRAEEVTSTCPRPAPVPLSSD